MKKMLFSLIEWLNMPVWYFSLYKKTSRYKLPLGRRWIVWNFAVSTPASPLLKTISGHFPGLSYAGVNTMITILKEYCSTVVFTVRVPLFGHLCIHVPMHDFLSSDFCLLRPEKTHFDKIIKMARLCTRLQDTKTNLLINNHVHIY